MTTRGELLRAPADLAIDPASQVTLTAHWNVQDGQEGETTLAVEDGSLSLRALPSGDLEIGSADVVLGDVDIPADVVSPDGLHFTDVRITLAEPASAPATWSADEEQAEAEIPLVLRVDWSLVSRGQVVPLAPLKISGLTATVEVTREGGELVARATGLRAGTFFDWAGVVQLSDLDVALAAKQR